MQNWVPQRDIYSSRKRCKAVMPGLTVTEAMWKGGAVVGGNVGGISRQIDDVANGLLVSSVEEATQRIVTSGSATMGEKAQESIRTTISSPRLLEQYLGSLTSRPTRSC